MKKTLLFFCFSLSIIFCHAQTMFQSTYGISHELPVNVIETTAGDYMLTGLTIVQAQYALSLYKTDSLGNLKWSKFGLMDVALNFCGCTKQIDSTTIVTIVTEQLSSLVIAFRYIKMDTSGQVISSRMYSIESDLSYLSATPTDDGGFLLAASHGTVQIIKIDRDGTPLWSRQYFSNVSLSGTHIVATHDGGFAVAGFYPQGGFSWQTFVVRVDSNHHVMWSRKYMTDPALLLKDEPTDICATNDGGIVCVGKSNNNSSSPTYQWMMKINSSGSLLWQNKYNGWIDDHLFRRVIQKSSGNFILMGLADEPYYDVDFRLMETDASGQSLWQHYIGNSYNEWPYELSLTRDGGYAVLSQGNQLAGVGNQLYLTKTDSMGMTVCYDTAKSYSQVPYNLGDSVFTVNDSSYTFVTQTSAFSFIDTVAHVSNYCSAVSSVEPVISESSFSISPNPVSELTTFSLHHKPNVAWTLKIFNLQGKQIKQVELYGIDYVFDARDFAPGIYIAEAITRHGAFFKKMIVSKN